MNHRVKQLLIVLVALFVFKLFIVELDAFKENKRQDLISKKTFDAKAAIILKNADDIDAHYADWVAKYSASNATLSVYKNQSDAQINNQEIMQKQADLFGLKLELFDWLNLEKNSNTEFSQAVIKIRLVGRPKPIVDFQNFLDSNRGYRVTRISATWSGVLKSDVLVNINGEIEVGYLESAE